MSPARAVTTTWTGNVSTDWHNPANWTAVPTGADYVTINTAPHGAQLSVGAAAIDFLTVGEVTQGRLLIDGGSMTVGGSNADRFGMLLGRFAGSDGQVTVSGTGSNLTVNAGVQIGHAGSGSLSVLAGGTVNIGLDQAYSEVLLGFANYGWGTDAEHGVGTVTIDGAGSTLNYAGGFNLLNGSTTLRNGGQMVGQVRAADGGTFWFDMIGFGVPANPTSGFQGLTGHADVTITGAGSAWISRNGLAIGSGGIGSLSILGGGSATLLGQAYLGEMSYTYDAPGGAPVVGLAGQSGSGTLRVSGVGSKLTVNAVASGNANNAGHLYVGRTGAGNNAVIVDNGGSIALAGLLDVGRGSNGTLGIASGGTVTVGGSDANGFGMMLGRFAGSDGKATVSGAGSTLSVVAGVRIGDAGSGMLSLSQGGQLNADGAIHIGANGALTIGGVDNTGSPVAPGSILAPSMLFDAPTSTLAFRHSATSYSYATPMSGNGHIDANGGFTQLTGDSSGFTGTTSIADGATLSVNGRLGGDLTVDVGGRLEGTGTVGNATVAGTLAPGNSPGTLHVSGDLFMQSGSIYEAQIDPVTGISDSVAVAGNVTIQPGTTLLIENLGNQPLAPGANIELIQTTGTVDGQFDAISGAVSTFLGYGVSYANGGIVIDVQRSSTMTFASVGSTPGQVAIGIALDSLPVGTALTSLVYSELTNAKLATAAFGQMAGSINADLRRVMLDDSRQLRGTIESRLQQADDTSTGSSFWVEGMGHWGSADAHADVPEVRSNGSGMMIGMDTGAGDASRLGAAIGFGQTSYGMAAQGASSHIRSRHAALYGRSTVGAFGINYGGAISWNDLDTRRNAAIGTIHQRLVNDHDARTDQLFVDAGYRIGEAAQRYAEPFIALAHARVRSSAAEESGGSAALSIRGDTDSASFGTLGLRWVAQGTTATWYGSVGWRHAFGFDRAVARQSFVAGGSEFEVAGLPMARNAAAIKLGTQFAVSKHARVAASYGGLLAGSARDHSASMRLTVDF